MKHPMVLFKIVSAIEPAIRNDKLYPGAQQTIDKHVYQYIDTLQKLHVQWQQTAFDSLKQVMCEKMFAELRHKSNGDSLVAAMKQQLNIKDSLEFVMLITDLEFAFEPREYTPIYRPGKNYPLINNKILEKKGVRIDGTLQYVDAKNQISGLVVSSPAARSYKIGFAVHIDTPDRVWGVVKKMMRVFLLSLFSILAVLVIFYLTFRNWLKQYSILVIDIQLPGMNGFELAERISRIDDTVPFLFLTARNEKKDRLHGLKLGADDYISKPFDIDELVLRIKNILRRNHKAVAPNPTCGDITLYKEQFKVSIAADKQVTLTQREFELLEYLFLNRNKILKPEEILQDLWRENDYFLGRSLDVFVSRLRKHLNASGR